MSLAFCVVTNDYLHSIVIYKRGYYFIRMVGGLGVIVCRFMSFVR